MDKPKIRPLRLLWPPWRLGSNARSARAEEIDGLSDVSVLAEWIFAGLVILGVVGEFIIAARHPPYDSRLGQWGPAFGDLLVALGVAGEVLASVIAHVCQGELTRRSNDRLAQVEFESGFAQERAAAMEKEAAEARRETERLKKEVAWRVLDTATARKLVAELSKIPSRVTLVWISGDPEATAYCAQFLGVFRQANWQVEVVGRRFQGSPVGVFVTHGERWNPTIQAEIEQLRIALTASGISVEQGGGSVEDKSPGFRVATVGVRVIIGHKPAPSIE